MLLWELERGLFVLRPFHELSDGPSDGGETDAYMSGSFCVSITAAIGIPKLEAGPQKSGHRDDAVSQYISRHGTIKAPIFPSPTDQSLSQLLPHDM